MEISAKLVKPDQIETIYGKPFIKKHQGPGTISTLSLQRGVDADNRLDFLTPPPSLRQAMGLWGD